MKPANYCKYSNPPFVLTNAYPHFHPTLMMCSRFFTGDLLFLLLSLISAVEGGGPAARELWCVAKNNAEDAALQSALDWTCGPGGADCGPIQNGGPCYDGADLQKTASYAFNDYCIKHGLSDETCNFSNTAALTSLNPSYGNCKFPSGSSSSNGTFSGSSTTDSGTADLTSSSTIYHWNRLLLFATVLVF